MTRHATFDWKIRLVREQRRYLGCMNTLMKIHLLFRCDGKLGTCSRAEEDSISVTTGTAQFMDQSFQSVIGYQYVTDKLYLRISGFSASCGQLTLKWFLLLSSSACNTVSVVKGTLPNSNAQQSLTGKEINVSSNVCATDNKPCVPLRDFMALYLLVYQFSNQHKEKPLAWRDVQCVA